MVKKKIAGKFMQKRNTRKIKNEKEKQIKLERFHSNEIELNPAIRHRQY